ncbi:tryptophan 2,3-dioxygenase [Dactylosporangium sp. CA-233914]|uniref:tryptophan 2,3-dioxygenase n=1 Tax=Dactylosporangium sp. CA-233914 TaxID=3239934 RepID=UPI003D8AAFCC
MSGPILDFPEQVPYDAYVHAGVLHSLQQPLTKDPGEMSFLMVSQVMELWFGLACHELRDTQRLLREDDVWGALAPLRRIKLHLEGLVAAWNGLRWMTPTDFNRFRGQLGEASGFQSAMYRHLEFLLGLKSEALIRPFKRQAELHQDLTAALAAPSVWDDVTATLARRGFEIPGEVLERDFTREYEPSPQVERAWVQIYHDDRGDNPLYALGEALTDVAEAFGDWRYKHLTAVQRTMGNKPGSGGSSGAAWLTRSMTRIVFPELWSARTVI